MIKKLPELFEDFPLEYSPTALPDMEITGIAMDSRAVKPGNLFVALLGGVVDGHQFIDEAIANGAIAVVVNEAHHEWIGRLPCIRVKDTRRSLTWIAAAFHDWPGRKMTVIGVTGTDGKTTTTNLVYQILLTAGIKAGMISTVNAVIGEEILDTGFHVTTPDAQDVQLYLARMVQAGLTHVVLETTSHGWAQHRVDACEFDIGIVTNITHEHLDQHGSYENYRAAKSRLFRSLARTKSKTTGNPRLAVINRDDGSYDFLNGIIKTPIVTYGIEQDAMVRGEDIVFDGQGMNFHIVAKDTNLRVAITTSLVGLYNISNCLAAYSAAVYGLIIEPDVAAQGIMSLQSIPGRMERIDLGQDFFAIVDFAHTPNALRVTLETARYILDHSKKHATSSIPRGAAPRNRVIAIFGSAGLRDREKRRIMAETSARLADLTILTAEDPRTESLDAILEEMSLGARAQGGLEGRTFWRVPDRGEAIRLGMRLAQPGDMVIYCGKGHEQSMCFGQREFLWDDRTAMRSALAEKMGIPGTSMPYLPTQDTPEREWLTWK